MSLRVCAEPSCPELVPQGTRGGRCATHRKERDRARGTTKERGYGVKHQRLRARLLRKAYGEPCPLCGELMLPGQALDLDHTEDRTGYRGMTHATCNRSDGARRATRGQTR